MLIATTVFAVTAVAAAFGTGFLLGHYTPNREAPWSKDGCSKLRCDREALTEALKNAAVSLNAAKEENAGLAKRVSDLTRHYLGQTERVRVIDQLRADADTRSTKLESEIELLKERGRHLAATVTEKAKVTEQAREVLDIQKELSAEFENSPIRAQKGPAASFRDVRTPPALASLRD
jgi:chromosome segregation ATPase